MPGFNWASTSRSRKLVTLGYPADALVRLQLGLDLAVEETRHHQGQVRRGEEASIGPRPRGRGNLLALRRAARRLPGFNWASTSRSRKPARVARDSGRL